MSDIPLGRRVRRVRYYTLPDAAWDRHPGLHDLDYGLDLDLDGEIWGFTWRQGSGILDVVPGSLRDTVPGADSIDASSIAPWVDLVGSPIVEVEADGQCLVRLRPPSGTPIWVMAGSYVDEADQVLECGDSVLVIHHLGLARSLGLE